MVISESIVAYADMHKTKNRRICRLFSEGTGAALVYDVGFRQNRSAFFYGITPRQVGLFNEVRASGVDWYYADNAYAPPPVFKANGQREELFRITKNAAQINGTGKGDPIRRDIYLPKIRPWRTGGRNILLCMQSEHHHRLWGEPRHVWLEKTLRALHQYSDRPVIMRDKPLRDPTAEPFEFALLDAWAVVTFNSRVAIEAILAGVPAFVTTECAASPMAGSDLAQIETPPRRDGRAEWAAVLAAHQWTVPEIVSGVAWRALQET